MFELNHIPFGTADIDAADEMLGALGFKTVRGHCRWPMPDATQLAPSLSVMFAHAYLDVIAYEGAPEGLAPSGLVLATDDFDGALARLSGFELRPYEIERTLENGHTIRYRITPVRGPGRLPISVLQDYDPRAMRTDEALDHPNGARGMSRVVLGTGNPDAARDDLARLTTDVELATDTARLRIEFAPSGPAYPWSAPTRTI